VVAASLPHLAGTALRFARKRAEVDRRVVRSFVVASAVSATVGAFAVRHVGSDALGVVLGVLVVLTRTST
jgi:uncharacterized membrane protein YfcA